MPPTPPERLFNLNEKAFVSTASQSLCYQTPRKKLLGSSDISKINTKPWLGLPITRWTESKDFLEFKQASLDETAFPKCPDQARIPFSHWLLLLFLSCKENALVYLSQTLTKGETYSSYYGFLEITLSWSWDKLIFHLRFSEGLEGSEFIKVFLSSEILMTQFLSKTCFWICNFTACVLEGSYAYHYSVYFW